MISHTIRHHTLVRALGAVSVLLTIGCSSADETEPTPIPPQEGEFSALSYNVAGLPQGISGSNPETNIPIMSPLLNAYDLVLAQEDFVYHAELSAEADHPHQTEPKVTHLKLVNDGLNRFSQFPWTSFERVQWVACYGDASTGASDCMAEKGFSLARTVLGERVTF
ncbi:MAG: endonuclease, partial [Deltaproteobacteria bacterium]|nr:endonuclease [Deltaproteobacteria bacterium]